MSIPEQEFLHDLLNELKSRSILAEVEVFASEVPIKRVPNLIDEDRDVTQEIIDKYDLDGFRVEDDFIAIFTSDHDHYRGGYAVCFENDNWGLRFWAQSTGYEKAIYPDQP